MKAQLQNKKILCRICKGDHFTTKCPYKDSLGMEDAAAPAAAAEEAGKFLFVICSRLVFKRRVKEQISVKVGHGWFLLFISRT